MENQQKCTQICFNLFLIFTFWIWDLFDQDTFNHLGSTHTHKNNHSLRRFFQKNSSYNL
jgi:hypothetical protein